MDTGVHPYTRNGRYGCDAKFYGFFKQGKLNMKLINKHRHSRRGFLKTGLLALATATAIGSSTAYAATGEPEK